MNALIKGRGSHSQASTNVKNPKILVESDKDKEDTESEAMDALEDKKMSLLSPQSRKSKK